MTTPSLIRAKRATKYAELHDEVRAPHHINSANSAPCALDDYLSRREFCQRYGISIRTAEMMAHKGQGPAVTHLGKRAFYHLDAIAAWCAAQRAKSEARFSSRGNT
jgi:hypothetical protein